MFKHNSYKYLFFLALTFFSIKSIAQNKLLSIDSLNQIEGITKVKDLPEGNSEVVKIVLKRERLTIIPPQIFDYTNLQYLDLSKNKIDSISPDIAKLKNLQVLILSKNQIDAFPYEIFLLSNLVILEANSNGVNYISPNIKMLTKLKSLDLWNTNVTTFPDEMTVLENLEVIDLRGITMNPIQQQNILELFPEVKVYMSMPCNCGF